MRKKGDEAVSKEGDEEVSKKGDEGISKKGDEGISKKGDEGISARIAKLRALLATGFDSDLASAAVNELPRLLDEIDRLRVENAKLRAGECLGTIPPTDVACQRDCYCSKACQTRDADGSRGDLSRTLVPQVLRDILCAACDLADETLSPNDHARRDQLQKLRGMIGDPE